VLLVCGDGAGGGGGGGGCFGGVRSRPASVHEGVVCCENLSIRSVEISE